MTKVLVLMDSPNHLRPIYAAWLLEHEAGVVRDAEAGDEYTVDCSGPSGLRIVRGLESRKIAVTPVTPPAHTQMDRVTWRKGLAKLAQHVVILQMDPDPARWVERLALALAPRGGKVQILETWKRKSPGVTAPGL